MSCTGSGSRDGPARWSFTAIACSSTTPSWRIRGWTQNRPFSHRYPPVLHVVAGGALVNSRGPVPVPVSEFLLLHGGERRSRQPQAGSPRSPTPQQFQFRPWMDPGLGVFLSPTLHRFQSRMDPGLGGFLTGAPLRFQFQPRMDPGLGVLLFPTRHRFQLQPRMDPGLGGFLTPRRGT